MIRQDAAMPVSRFCELIGIPRRTYTRWRARARDGVTGKGPWPAPVVDALEPVAAKYAADWPAWGHRKIHWLMRADGIEVSASSVERAMRRRGLLQHQRHRLPPPTVARKKWKTHTASRRCGKPVSSRAQP